MIEEIKEEIYRRLKFQGNNKGWVGFIKCFPNTNSISEQCNNILKCAIDLAIQKTAEAIFEEIDDTKLRCFIQEDGTHWISKEDIQELKKKVD